MLIRLSLIATVLFASAPSAEEREEDLGTLNPEEMTWGNNIAKIERGETDMALCASGYLMTKSGDHETARKIFEACAEAGYTGTMTWMSYMENNGFGGEYNPDASAEWDRRAAEMGDPVGKFNHGINLMRGHGIARDETLGRMFVDQAAADGLSVAKRLQRADYDLDEVTPDADNWRYAPSF
ncbi:tetratricopeptide repeat protein [Thalassococcus lentus]|uniref:Sel1 repeat family protein n=1 Tax=Thalassococcus lentus TaxID=1210524 RepID=A0ABT4XQY8_9RHOB|nr:sel1 repeat family protein [Thalassococcus lentus]MDA7424361.1 sel1 repeat family protein [Thalassococcus lentus]